MVELMVQLLNRCLTVLMGLPLAPKQVLITSAKEGGYIFGAVCLSVCLSVSPSITRKLVNGF